MLRRDFVRVALAFGLSPTVLLGEQTNSPLPPPPAPVPWTLGLNANTPLPQTAVIDEIAESASRFFTTQQMATLSRLCDVVLPPIGDKPGALQAGTPMFLDFLIGHSSEVRKKMYTGGLDWLDAEAQKKYHTPFARVNGAEADALLKPWLRSWMSDHPPTEAHADFINIAHDDIRTATVNSEEWSSVPSMGAEESTVVGLYWSPIEPDVYRVSERGRMPAHVLAVPKASHPIPIYPR